MNVAALVQRGAHSVPPPLSKLPCSDLPKRQLLLLLLFRSAPANANASSSFSCTDLHTVAHKVQSALHHSSLCAPLGKVTSAAAFDVRICCFGSDGDGDM